MARWSSERAAVAAAAAAVVVYASSSATVGPLATSPAPADRPETAPLRLDEGCGTKRNEAAARPRALEPVPDGTPVSFEQDPPILLPTYSGEIRLRRFEVVGDIAQLAFQLRDPESSAWVPETWTRTATRTVAGRLISVFEPAWANDALARHLRRTIRGFDYPSIYWGRVEVPGSDPPAYLGVGLRLGSTGIATSPVVRISDVVQYSSHVVNLVLPEFGDTRISRGAKDYDQPRVARAFYSHFTDDYDGLAIVPAATHLADHAAFHGNVNNEVEGIGLPLFDASAAYGSDGRLQGIEVYLQAALPENGTSSREIGHQWGHYFDWERLGIRRVGGDSAHAHAPLWFPGETLIGGVLAATKRVGQRDEVSFNIETTPPPVRQHPLDLYAMGLATPEQIAPLVVFEDQGQFEGSSPSVGTPVIGPRRPVSVNDIMGLHGSRQGPVASVWRRATIVVSRDGLISQAEMDYWNYFAARLEDADRTGALSFDGYPSFDASTGWRMGPAARSFPPGSRRRRT